MPARQPKRGRLWLNDGSCIRLRPEHPNHVWSYDFVEDRTHNGRKFRMLNVIDEFTRECIAIRIDRKLKSTDVIDVCPTSSSCAECLDMFGRTTRPEFVAKRCANGYGRSERRQRSSSPAAHGRNGYCESFNAKLRDELLNGEIFYSLAEARHRHRELGASTTTRAAAFLAWLPPASTQRRAIAGCATPNPLRRPHQTSPTSPPCIRFELGHLVGQATMSNFAFLHRR